MEKDKKIAEQQHGRRLGPSVTTRNRGFPPPTCFKALRWKRPTILHLEDGRTNHHNQMTQYCLVAERSTPLIHTRVNLNVPDSRPHSGEFHLQDVLEETKLQSRKWPVIYRGWRRRGQQRAGGSVKSDDAVLNLEPGSRHGAFRTELYTKQGKFGYL